MMRLIDADKIEKWTWQEPRYSDSINDRTDLRDFLRSLPTIETDEPHWISVRDISDEEICAAKIVLSVIENVDYPLLMCDAEKSAVKKALLLMLRICEAASSEGVSE